MYLLIVWVPNCLVAFSQGSNENLHHIHFLPQRDAWDNLLCSTGKETFFLTDSSQQNKHSWMAHEWKFGGSRIWFGINFSQQSNWTRNNKSAALRTKHRNITYGFRCRDSRGGVNSTYRTSAQCPGGTFKFKRVTREYWTQRECSIVCAYDYGRPVAKFNQTASCCMPYRA